MAMNTPDMDRLAAQADVWRRRGDFDRAEEAFAQLLAKNEAYVPALRGRARIALARGEGDAPQWFERALQADPGDADLWLGKAQALDVAGDANGALTIAQQLAQQAPRWLQGMRFLAQLRLGQGETNFADHYAEAVRKAPNDPNIWHDWANRLAAVDRFADAAEVASQATQNFAGEPLFELLYATHASAAGDLEIAEDVFVGLELDTAERLRNEARHRIRRREFTRAERLLLDAIEQDGDDIAAWALLGLVWRAMENKEANWLHGQTQLCQRLELLDAENSVGQAQPILHRLHNSAAMPMGQSLRGGTQTRGNLFDRLEPELGALKTAIEASLEAYRAHLPDDDTMHPLLRHRNKAWQIAGSWSVRLSGGGDYHTSHIHPSGVVSSALYIELPHKTVDEEAKAGWLELGRPPADLMLDLEPLDVIEPKQGHLALFPSTLYHGTRPFCSGQRMSVAFDVIAKP